MSKELVTTEHVDYIEKNLSIIQSQFGLNKDQLGFFAIQCKRTGLDPITRQIYAIPATGNKLNIMASIDGLRLIAERTGDYEGQTKAEWCGDDGVWTDVWLKSEPPKAARVGVYRKKFREALVAVALYHEYAGAQPGFMWKKMPALMIAKVAEALALRKAFPNEMSGIYSTEEMDQAQPSQAQENVKDIQGVMNDVGWAKPQDVQKETVAAANAIISNTFGEYEIKFGKRKGQKLKDIEHMDLIKYLTSIDGMLKNGIDGKPITGKLRANAEELLDAGDKFINSEINVIEPELNTSETIPF